MSLIQGTFHTLEDASQEFKRLASTGESRVIHLCVNPNPSNLDAYVLNSEEIVREYLVTDRKIPDQFRATMLNSEMQQTYQKVKSLSVKPVDSFLGKDVRSKLLRTIDDEVVLQLVTIEEWWQAFGGAHVADTIELWLINHEPVEPVQK